VRMVEKLSPRERKVFIKLMMRLVGVDEATDLSILNAAAE
jgi:hypothetical protein